MVTSSTEHEAQAQARDDGPHGAADSVADVGLATGGVAQRLGVSPTTVRSWERRYGIGPAHRQEGHHRRWSPQDIAVLEAMCRLTARGVPPGEAARAVLAERAAASRDGSPPPLSAGPAPPVAQAAVEPRVAAAPCGSGRYAPSAAACPGPRFGSMRRRSSGSCGRRWRRSG
ncbi:MerR family transcriptional regulator [Kitasatospora aburaviensis]